MKRGFNCVETRKTQLRILEEGFRVSRPDNYYFETYFSEFKDMLPENEQEAVHKLDDLASDADRVGDFEAVDKFETKAVKLLKRLWLRRFSGGLLWVGKEPLREYGKYCLEITIPSTAKLFVTDIESGPGVGGIAFYLPEGYVAPELVREIP